MKDKRSVEEQVRDLTEEQRDDVLRADKYGNITLLALTLPGMLLLCFGFVAMHNGYTLLPEIMYPIFQILGSVMVIASLVGLIVIKKKFPDHSDKKASFIRKIRR